MPAICRSDGNDVAKSHALSTRGSITTSCHYHAVGRYMSDERLNNLFKPTHRILWLLQMNVSPRKIDQCKDHHCAAQHHVTVTNALTFCRIKPWNTGQMFRGTYGSRSIGSQFQPAVISTCWRSTSICNKATGGQSKQLFIRRIAKQIIRGMNQYNHRSKRRPPRPKWPNSMVWRLQRKCPRGCGENVPP